MRINRLTPQEALTSLRSDASGLTTDEARRHLAEYGANRIEEMSRSPAPSEENDVLMLPFALTMLALEEGRKALARRASPQRAP